jgi:hypothetical protein
VADYCISTLMRKNDLKKWKNNKKSEKKSPA